MTIYDLIDVKKKKK